MSTNTTASGEEGGFEDINFFDSEITGIEILVYYVFINILVLFGILFLAAKDARKSVKTHHQVVSNASIAGDIKLCCTRFLQDICTRSFIYSAFLIHVWDSGMYAFFLLFFHLLFALYQKIIYNPFFFVIRFFVVGKTVFCKTCVFPSKNQKIAISRKKNSV